MLHDAENKMTQSFINTLMLNVYDFNSLSLWLLKTWIALKYEFEFLFIGEFSHSNCSRTFRSDGKKWGFKSGKV